MLPLTQMGRLRTLWTFNTDHLYWYARIKRWCWGTKDNGVIPSLTLFVSFLSAVVVGSLYNNTSRRASTSIPLFRFFFANGAIHSSEGEPEHRCPIKWAFVSRSRVSCPV